MEQLITAVREFGPLIFGISGGTIFSVLLFVFVAKNFLYIRRPNEVLIFSGRDYQGTDGMKRGFRVITDQGRKWRMPIFEQIERMDLSNISVPMSVVDAYSEGADGNLGIPLSLHAVANVKVARDPGKINNAVERFLGRGREEIARVAKETLEGHLRGVLAKMTPEEVNEDRLKFADMLTQEAAPDLEKLGLHLDTLKIQHVSDKRDYLESIGRTRISQVLAAAVVAESDAVRTAEEAEALGRARGDVAKMNAEAKIAQKRNELRQVVAELNAEAQSEEERAIAAAEAARAEAEKELQEIRGDLERLRLAADVTIPADAVRRSKELRAAGRAAKIAENGRAMASALHEVSEAWKSSGGQAMDMYVLQNLEEIFGQVAAGAGKTKIREVNLVDSGDGSTLPAYLSAYPASVGALFGEVSKTLGIDIERIISGKERAKHSSTTTAGPGAKS